VCLDLSVMAGEGRQKTAWAGISWLVYAYLRARYTHPMRVPEQANGSTMDSGYEVSAKLSRSADLRRIC
jgi:hypothetical protein